LILFLRLFFKPRGNFINFPLVSLGSSSVFSPPPFHGVILLLLFHHLSPSCSSRGEQFLLQLGRLLSPLLDDFFSHLLPFRLLLGHSAAVPFFEWGRVTMMIGLYSHAFSLDHCPPCGPFPFSLYSPFYRPSPCLTIAMNKALI